MPMAARVNPGGGRTVQPPTRCAEGSCRSLLEGLVGGDRAPSLALRIWRAMALKIASPSCSRMNNGGCVGMAVEVLSMGLFAPPVGCSKWDNVGRGRMKHCLILHF
jgi:hypothetical protein